MAKSQNFSFLAGHDARLDALGALAERYFRADPSTALIKLRQFAEILSKLIAARQGTYRDDRDSFDETLRRLSFERAIPKQVADLFHALRKTGNAAAHEARGDHAAALDGLKFARALGIWFHQTFGREPTFKPGPFVPPSEPVDATHALHAQIEELYVFLSGTGQMGLDGDVVDVTAGSVVRVGQGVWRTWRALPDSPGQLRWLCIRAGGGPIAHMPDDSERDTERPAPW